MNYKKRYNKALERAKKMLASKRSVIVKRQALETIFPELIENEDKDERIRKELLEHCKKLSEMYNTLLTAEEYNKKQSWIAWLEKQGEQNLANSAKICKEDEEMLDSIIEDFGNGKTSNMLQEQWLKSLKERFGCEANCTTKKNEE